MNRICKVIVIMITQLFVTMSVMAQSECNQAKVIRTDPKNPENTEKENKKNGVSLNDMQVKLLQKIEELTLYVIELKKQNERLENQIQTITNTKR